MGEERVCLPYTGGCLPVDTVWACVLSEQSPKSAPDERCRMTSRKAGFKGAVWILVASNSLSWL